MNNTISKEEFTFTDLSCGVQALVEKMIVSRLYETGQEVAEELAGDHEGFAYIATQVHELTDALTNELIDEVIEKMTEDVEEEIEAAADVVRERAENYVKSILCGDSEE